MGKEGGRAADAVGSGGWGVCGYPAAEGTCIMRVRVQAVCRRWAALTRGDGLLALGHERLEVGLVCTLGDLVLDDGGRSRHGLPQRRHRALRPRLARHRHLKGFQPRHRLFDLLLLGKVAA